MIISAVADLTDFSDEEPVASESHWTRRGTQGHDHAAAPSDYRQHAPAAASSASSSSSDNSTTAAQGQRGGVRLLTCANDASSSNNSSSTNENTDELVRKPFSFVSRNIRGLKHKLHTLLALDFDVCALQETDVSECDVQ